LAARFPVERMPLGADNRERVQVPAQPNAIGNLSRERKLGHRVGEHRRKLGPQAVAHGGEHSKLVGVHVPLGGNLRKVVPLNAAPFRERSERLMCGAPKVCRLGRFRNRKRRSADRCGTSERYGQCACAQEKPFHRLLLSWHVPVSRLPTRAASSSAACPVTRQAQRLAAQARWSPAKAGGAKTCHASAASCSCSRRSRSRIVAKTISSHVLEESFT